MYDNFVNKPKSNKMATKVLTTLRTHWKKSIFFSGACVYGLKFAQDKYEENILMRDYCRRASVFGQQTFSSAGQKPYHVTVILNPAANNGKGRKQFEKYCAPILHLAGIKVSVIRTEGIGQAKEIMKIMDDADAVLIAGGDGTLMEAMTGLLRRPDSNQLCQTVPVGILPIGVKNHMATNLFPDTQSSGQVALMAEAAMSVVEQLFRPVDVMEVKNIDNPDVHPLYGLRQLRVGVFDEAHSRIDKYWYWAVLKKYMAYIFAFTTSKDVISWHIPSSIKLGNLVQEEIEVEEKPKSSSWWSFFSLPSSSSSRSSNKSMKTTTQWTEEFDYSGCELTIESGNNFPQQQQGAKDDCSEGKMTLSLGPNEMSFNEFVREGWRREQQLLDIVPDSWLKRSNCQTFLWHPNLEALKKNNPDEDKYFYLDSESVEILGGPLQISCIPQKVVMFCSRSISAKPNQPQHHQESPKKWYLKQHMIQQRPIATNFQ